MFIQYCLGVILFVATLPLTLIVLLVVACWNTFLGLIAWFYVFQAMAARLYPNKRAIARLNQSGDAF